MTSVVWLQQGAERIDATTVNVTSATVLDATFDIPGAAPTGLYDVNVEQVGGAGVVTLANGFTINALCSITDVAAGTQTACDPATNTYTQEVTVTYSGAPATGSLLVNGQSFAIGSSPQTVTLTALPANGLAVDVTASFADSPTCTLTESALFTAPVSCAAGPCSISDLAADDQSACDPATNTYTQAVVVTFENPPATGNLVVNGQTFAIGTSPQSVTLTGLAANGLAVDVTASFSDSPTCTLTETALFTAPVSCAVNPCAISDLAAGTQTACDPATNTYTQEVVVTFANPPATGNLVVNGQAFAIGTSPQTVTLTALAANGLAVDVTANFSDSPTCTLTETALFTAPVSCGVNPCAISDLAAGTQTACDPATNTYTQEVVVTFANPPATGNLVVNGQAFAIGTSPQTVTLTALAANGLAVDVTASFADSPACTLTETALFTAPASCGVNPCSISDLAAGTQTTCDPATNTYTQVVVVTFTNPPATGNLVVNGQSFAIGTSPQSVTLTGLAANGLAVDVTASFADSPACTLTETALFTAPAACAVACAITDLAAGAQTPCDPATNDYTQVVIVTFENPPATGTLLVNGQSFPIGVSPQSVTLVGLNSNGAPVTVTAVFSEDKGCDRTETALFTAPVTCQQGGGLDCSDAEPSKEVLWPPNHRFKTIRIEDVTESDEDVDITITAVTSDEPVDGSGDGNTCPDAIINDDGTVDLRAERAGNGNGRVYTILFTATDATGASCDDTVFVCVPRDRGGRGDDDDDDDDDDLTVGGNQILDGDHGRHGRHGRHRRHRDRDCDHDDDVLTLPGDVIMGGDHDGDRRGHRRNRCCDRDRDVITPPGDVIMGGDHDGDRHGRKRCRNQECVRDEEQFDATVCEDQNKVTLSGATALPLVARVTGEQMAILFTNGTAGPVDLRIFDLRGRLVRHLASQQFPAGRHTLHWDGRDASGRQAASGIYLVRAVMAGEAHTAKTVWVH